MNLNERSRNVLMLLLAAVGPFAIVWTGIRVMTALRATPAPVPAAVGVVHLSDYFTEADTVLTQSLSSGFQLWNGDPGDGVSFFNDMTLAGDLIALVSDARFVALDRRSGDVVRDTVTDGNNKSLRSLGATTLTADPDTNDVWIYSWQSGQVSRYDVRGNFKPLETWLVEPSLTTLHWRQRQILASGPFETALLRFYAPDKASPLRAQDRDSRDDTSQSPISTAATMVLGKPLFPRLMKAIAKPLNVTFVGLKPTGDKIAVAFQWSDQIQVFDLTRMALERAIAGPVESRLDFAVARLDGRPIFTLSDGTTYSYMDVAVTNHAILALYAGRERRTHPGAAGLGGEIHAFTWDGRLAGVWRLQDPVQKIAVDPDSETLYALRWRPSHSVVAIDVKELLNAVQDVWQDGSRRAGDAP